jgi:predicted nucleotide-binding protein
VPSGGPPALGWGGGRIAAGGQGSPSRWQGAGRARACSRRTKPGRWKARPTQHALTRRQRHNDDVPSRRRNVPQSTPPPGQSALRIPQAEAEAQLTGRIALGRELLSYEPSPAGPYGLRDEIAQWRDYNRTWLDANLGGDAAEEYRTASTHWGSAMTPDDPVIKLKFLRQELQSEISKLQSIHGRLHVWAPETATMPSKQVSPDSPIFIVHGSDTLRAESLARTVDNATGRKTIILREEPHLGRTLMEKFEQHAAETSYAIIVLTADDKGCRADETDTRPRGRQNVILEMGYFYALLGRDRVSVLLQPAVEKPSDMDGIVYITFDDNGAWKTELFRELRHAGFSIDL